MAVMMVYRRRSTILSENRFEVVAHLREIFLRLTQVAAGEVLPERGKVLLNGVASRRRDRGTGDVRRSDGLKVGIPLLRAAKIAGLERIG